MFAVKQGRFVLSPSFILSPTCTTTGGNYRVHQGREGTDDSERVVPR
jgi:hypothetical protein